MPRDWDNNTWSLSYSHPRKLNVVRKQKTSTPPLPKYTRLPALLKTIKEVPDVTILTGDCGNAGKKKESGMPGSELDEGRHAIELLLERALFDRRRQLESGQPMLKRKRSPIENEDNLDLPDDVSDKDSRSHSTNDEKSSDSGNGIQTISVQERIFQPRRSKALQVDDIGPSGKCSSYALSKNPRCVQRTEKAYIDALRARLDANPTKSREVLISAERKLENDRLEVQLNTYMNAINSIPPKYEKCQNCEKEFDATWNDYESCNWHPGTRIPDYQNDDWWPASWSREEEDVDFDTIEAMIYTALEHDHDQFAEGFKWDCCQEWGGHEGCELGRHIGPNEDLDKARNKRQRKR